MMTFFCHFFEKSSYSSDSCHKSKIQKHMVTTFIWVRFFSSSWSTVLVLLLGSEGLIMLTFSTWENSGLIFSWKHGVSSSWNKIVETFHNFFEGTKSRSEASRRTDYWNSDVKRRFVYQIGTLNRISFWWPWSPNKYLPTGDGLCTRTDLTVTWQYFASIALLTFVVTSSE